MLHSIVISYVDIKEFLSGNDKRKLIPWLVNSVAWEAVSDGGERCLDLIERRVEDKRNSLLAELVVQAVVEATNDLPEFPPWHHLNRCKYLFCPNLDDGMEVLFSDSEDKGF
jgi:hypothetical protein